MLESCSAPNVRLLDDHGRPVGLESRDPQSPERKSGCLAIGILRSLLSIGNYYRKPRKLRPEVLDPEFQRLEPSGYRSRVSVCQRGMKPVKLVLAVLLLRVKSEVVPV